MRKSESIGKISEALAKAQGQMKPAAFDATNPHFRSKYASLTSIMEACREALSQNNIAVIQSPSFEEGRLIITTLLTHSSGEWIEDSLSINAGKDTAQALGSAITYAKRYSLSSMVGIVSDEDDDAEATKPNNSSQKSKTVLKPVPSGQTPSAPKKLTKAQKTQADRVIKIREIFTLSAKLNFKPDQMKAIIGGIIGLPGSIKESSDIPDDKMDEIINEFSAQLQQKNMEAA
jgi:preprotein translocase subunit SecD